MCTGAEAAVISAAISGGSQVASAKLTPKPGGGELGDEPSFTPLPGVGGAQPPQQGFVDPNPGRGAGILQAGLGIIPNLILQILEGRKGRRNAPQQPQPQQPGGAPMERPEDFILFGR